MTDIWIGQEIFYGVCGVAILMTFISIGIGLLLLSNREIMVMLKANLTKRPIIQIHTALKQTMLYAPKLRGKGNKYNIFDIPEYGIKFTPLPDMVEHIGSSRHIQYYSKAPLGLEAKAIAAFRDIENLLKLHGITPTETVLDIIITMSDDEIKKLYEIPAESLDHTHLTLTPDDMLNIRDRLRNMFIKEGQFVWETAKNFVFLMQTETARSLDESIAIAREQAIEDARLGAVDKSTSMTIIYIITLLMGGVIAYKMLVG